MTIGPTISHILKKIKMEQPIEIIFGDIPEEGTNTTTNSDNSIIPDDWIIEMLEGNQPDFWWVY